MGTTWFLTLMAAILAIGGDPLEYDGVPTIEKLVSGSEQSTLSKQEIAGAVALRPEAVDAVEPDGVHLAFGPGVRLRMLLYSKEVRAELGLREDDLPTVSLLRQELRERDRQFLAAHCVPGNRYHLSGANPGKVRGAWHTRWRRDLELVEESLGKHAVARLKQILFQLNGLPKMLVDAEVRNAIGLSADDARKFLAQCSAVKFMSIHEAVCLRLNGSKDLMSGSANDTAVAEYVQKRASVCRDQLTKTQRERWEELIGPKIPAIRSGGFHQEWLGVEEGIVR